MDTGGKFYLGRIFDPATGKVTAQPVLYDPADLTTHAVVVGMTGSGKTGLCIDLLEEAALQGIPALMIDPKGDISNALLHFPDLLPEDFQPWVSVDQARRDGKSVEQAAADAAERWQKGLAEWDIPQERVRALQNAASFAVYTPGSDAGIPVSILASLKCPPLPWQEYREVLREKISGTATALLGLVGLTNIDPVRSREHILLANIFEQAWSQGKDLDLGELILQTQTPPFAKLGVFDVNTFFPEKDRFELAMLLNNILAAPAFQSWIEGQPLDVQSLLYAKDGRPRHSIFYIAHLPDAERMFFVTLLYAAVETWMRSQPGTAALRAIIYFDEIFGYMPPVGNPPCKPGMLRMLKQARAFGVGQVLVTQNPVDMDYKALSNAGTWLIGKLQTEQDRQRLLDGLQSALADALDRPSYDKLISALGKRVFLMHNVHARGPQLFQTRWTMNYLAGPLTRAQIPALNQLSAGEETLAAPRPVAPAASAAARAAPVPALDEYQPVPIVSQAPAAAAQEPAMTLTSTGSSTRPTLPAGVREYFLPNNVTFTQAFKTANRSYPGEALSQGVIYHPAILGQANIRFLNRKYNMDTVVYKTVLVTAPDRRGLVRWDDFTTDAVDLTALESEPDPHVKFATAEAPFTEGKTMAALKKDFLDWVYRAGQVLVKANEALKLYAGPETSPAEFRTLCADTARQERDAEIRKVTATYETKINSLLDKLGREERELAEDQTELGQRKMEEFGTHAENILGLFGARRGRRVSTSLSKHRMTEQAKAEVDESIDAIAVFKDQIAALEDGRDQVLAEISEKWGRLANQVTDIPVAALKKDVLLDAFGVLWIPYYVVKVGDGMEELPGYSVK